MSSSRSDLLACGLEDGTLLLLKVSTLGLMRTVNCTVHEAITSLWFTPGELF